MSSDEGLNRGRRIDVGDGDDRRDVHAHLGELAPRDFELIFRRHVGHRAPGREIRQHDLLVRAAQDVGTLRHEVHAAEDDVFSGVPRRGGLRQLQRVADVVGELDDFVALVVVAEDDEAFAERLLGCSDPRVHLVVGQTEVAVGQRLALADALLLNLRSSLTSIALPCRLQFRIRAGDHVIQRVTLVGIASALLMSRRIVAVVIPSGVFDPAMW